jgi:hypothetical protein
LFTPTIALRTISQYSGFIGIVYAGAVADPREPPERVSVIVRTRCGL